MNVMKKLFLLAIMIVFTFFSCQSGQNLKNVEKTQNPVPMDLKNFDTIQLIAPDTMGGKSLMQAFQHRKSDREFKQTPLSLKHLSEILWAAYGINRPDGKRTVPSAMALYPLQVYAVLSNGIYRYEPQPHRLVPVVKGDYRKLAGLQDFVYTAPLNLIFIADFNKYNLTQKEPDVNSMRMVSLDAGHCTQNVYLYCASEGLKCVVRAGAKSDELLSLLGLDSHYRFIVAQTVGY
jgi:SagB-type dehydrogenase family enzyme